MPYAGVDIAAFEIIKEHMLTVYDGAPPPLAILGAGMVSSSIAQFASYPLALVRTRLQVGPFQCTATLVKQTSHGCPLLCSAVNATRMGKASEC